MGRYCRNPKFFTSINLEAKKIKFKDSLIEIVRIPLWAIAFYSRDFESSKAELVIIFQTLFC